MFGKTMSGNFAIKPFFFPFQIETEMLSSTMMQPLFMVLACSFAAHYIVTCVIKHRYLHQIST
ncbi:hypothetical protein HMPREF0971_00602 [Segatella oris F0302]|uniref:Uncharacterized protein n=1 Tax=Segatella oris F0302 TaxID=649760 RepID=D1QNV1_9BACT|nr:hypothetical protein HMPREF0971_00602 [Segatella oris F0302]